MVLLINISGAEEQEARRLLSDLILTERGGQLEKIVPLYDHGDEIINDTVAGWRVGEVVTRETPDGEVALPQAW